MISPKKKKKKLFKNDLSKNYLIKEKKNYLKMVLAKNY